MSSKGVKQAAENAKLVAKYLLDAGIQAERLDLVSSPLQRARQTADAIAKTNDRFSPISLNLVFRELSQGHWEGLTSQQVKDSYYEERKRRKTDRWNFHPVDGESMADRCVLIDQALRTLQPHTIIITHSMVLRIIWHLLGELTREDASTIDVPHVGLLIWNGTKLRSIGANAL